MRISAGLFVVACLLAPPAFAVETRCRAADAELIAAIKEVQDKQRNVGVQAAIRLDGRTVFSQALGLADREANIPVSAATRFPVASITKAFTGVAALKAAAAGVLDLDSPIQNYVPEFPVKPELTITPRRLAAHRAGIRHWGPERTELLTRHFDGLNQIVALFAADPLLAEGGRRYQYSSYGYNLLGLAVERATGVDFPRYVQDQILSPLHLADTGFDDVRDPRPVAKLYSAFDLVTYAEFPAGSPLIDIPVRDYSHNLAGGNMSSTAEDLARFGEALLKPGFVPSPQFELLYTQPSFDGVASPATFGGFALDAASERRLAFSGANPGVQAGLMVFPERGLAVSVLSNTWGFGSRSGEMVTGLPARLADLCAPRP